MNDRFSHFFTLGSAIIVMSTSGVLGRYLTLPPAVTIWIRCIIGAIAISIFLIITKRRIFPKFPNRRHFWVSLLSSIFLGAHWVTYFYSLQLSSVAIAMLALFTYPVITAFLEPILLKSRFDPINILFGLLAFVGVVLLVPELNLENNYTLGIVVGIVSSLFYSLRNILLKTTAATHSGSSVMLFQLVVNALLLSPFLFLLKPTPTSVLNQWQGLLILGVFTTALGHTLFVLSFKSFTVTTVSIISSLTPLIGILLGFLFLDEIPNNETYIGGTLIFLTALGEGIRSMRSHNELNSFNSE